MIRKLEITLTLFLLLGCTSQNANNTPKEPTRPFNELQCTYLEDDYYFCNKEYEENGDYIIYRNGEIVNKIILENGAYLYHDDTCDECVYIPSVSTGITWELDGNQVFCFGHDQYYTMIYNKYTGEVLHTIEGFLAQLTVNGTPSTNWITTYDNSTHTFKLLDRNTFQHYHDFNLGLQEAPALNINYPLGNGTYFFAYKTTDDNTYRYILDYEGNVVYGPVEHGLSLGTSTEYFEIIKDGKYGLINLQGEEVLPTIYDALEADRNGITAIKDHRLYIYSTTLTPLVNGEYKVAPKEYQSYLCCDNTNNFTAYNEGDTLIVTTIDTDYYYDREHKQLNPEYTHKFQVQGETIIELEYDYRY